MKTYDWIVIGGGLAGSALSYELAIAGLSVLLLEQATLPNNATRYSYGGIAYWSGNTDLTRQLCQAGIDRHRHLSEELGATTQFRELDLLLTIAPDRDPAQVAAIYQPMAIPPQVLSVATACELEPMLRPEAIGGALHVKHGHVSPEATVQAYQQAFLRHGGEIHIAQVTGFLQQHDRLTGVTTTTDHYAAAQVAVAAGGMSRFLLQAADRSARLYHTQAELIETDPIAPCLRTLVMPAELQRFGMEAQAGRAEVDALWDEPGHEIMPLILDAGVVQLQDGRLRMGQISRTLTDPEAVVDAQSSEVKLRSRIGDILPTLQTIPGRWCSCLVSFSRDRLPLVGELPDLKGLHLFTGFSNPFALLPPIARRFAQAIVTGQSDSVLGQFSPDRFR